MSTGKMTQSLTNKRKYDTFPFLFCYQEWKRWNILIEKKNLRHTGSYAREPMFVNSVSNLNISNLCPKLLLSHWVDKAPDEIQNMKNALVKGLLPMKTKWLTHQQEHWLSWMVHRKNGPWIFMDMQQDHGENSFLTYHHTSNLFHSQ